MELDEALARISEIRRQMAQTATFRGYRALTTALSGGSALLAAWLQSWLAPAPMHQLQGYLAIWVGAAAINVLAFTIELAVRYRRTESTLQREMTLLAAGQFVPALLAGAFLAVVIVQTAPAVAWMLPGLWSILFGLGIFASRRLLPAPVFYLGAFYVLAGLVVLGRAQGAYALHPLAMGLTFGLGQFLNAAVLYWTLERRHAEA
ncbi:MAG: hypothetical protein ACHRHE_02615 [Tepidisphaerales bacterium]